jgi:hypothetical protein
MKKYLFLILFSISSASMADQLVNTYHIKRIFAEGASTAGFYTTEGLPECKWGIMYISLGNEVGKAQLSIALTAKTANQTIKRLDFTVDAAGVCRLTGMHME